LNGNGLLGGLSALMSAVVWGSGDFAGGLASRNRDQFQILLLISFAGMLTMLAGMLVTHEGFPGPASILWSLAAGVSGALGMAALYQGLATAQAALVAPSAAVISVVFPVLVGSLLHGAPSLEKWIGMAIGLAGIWLVSMQRRASGETRGLGLAILAGLGFAGFFLCIVQTDSRYIFSPLVLSKLSACSIALLVLLVRRTRLPVVRGNGLAFLAGLLDGSGNAFYLLAARLTRPELAVVLSAMAPVMTVLLAGLISKQKVSTFQKLGVGLCLVAIALILV
jgi:drug/metabolite transporter (DMT)-like permease